MIKGMIVKARAAWENAALPPAAKSERNRDLSSGPGPDPGIKRAVDESVEWLCRAQDNSTTRDGGVAHHYSLLSGWGPSYPEVTGYIVPTVITAAERRQDEKLLQRARRMLDWLVSIQLPDGGFQAGTINTTPVSPCTFDTGQILFGLSIGAAKFGEPYSTSMHKAAEWLVNTQDVDGCWRRYPAPCVVPGDKTYDTHVAWSLLEAARVAPQQHYAAAALRNVQWALTKQQPNGWFSDCCLDDPSQPYTHTIGYVLRGVLEAHRYTDDPALLEAARRTGTGLLSAIGPDSFLPGRLNSQFKGTVDWSCLTGNVQIAHCLLMLFRYTGDKRFRDAAYELNRYVRRTVSVDGLPETRGGVKGSFPVSGGYGKYQYLCWAAKFFIDSNLLEQEIRNDSQ